jgi:hypothetical protein
MDWQPSTPRSGLGAFREEEETKHGMVRHMKRAYQLVYQALQDQAEEPSERRRR